MSSTRTSSSNNGLVRVRIAAATPATEWAVGREVCLPASLLPGGRGADGDPVDLRELPPPAPDAARDLRLRAAFTERAPLSSRLPFSYQRVPGWARAAIARRQGQRLRTRADEWARFPRWPLDLSADLLADWACPDTRRADLAGCGADRPARSADLYGPRLESEGASPVVLTHDIDSPEGLKNLADLFLPMEEAAGARSTSYVVPHGWPLDLGLLREVRGRGHAIGVHGFDHSNRTPFVTPRERAQRLRDGISALEEFGPQGYRAPSLLRTASLLGDLADHYLYDSSIPTSGGPFPVPNNGCASARPFRIGRLVEIPVTLPRDGSLLFLGHPPEEIAAMWERTAGEIAAARGIVVLLVHCERRFSGNAPMLEAYRRFLEFVGGSQRFDWSTAASVAAAGGAS